MWKGLKNKCDKVSERMKLAAKNIKKISKKRYKTRLDDLDSYENHSDLNYLNTDKVKKIGFYFVVRILKNINAQCYFPPFLLYE